MLSDWLPLAYLSIYYYYIMYVSLRYDTDRYVNTIYKVIVTENQEHYLYIDNKTNSELHIVPLFPENTSHTALTDDPPRNLTPQTLAYLFIGGLCNGCILDV